MGAIFNRKPQMFGLDYTERQLAILNDDVPITEVRVNELTAIMKKARERADDMNFDIAQGLYDLKLHPSEYMPNYTMDEAKALLQSLTPWEIHWNE